MDLMWITEESRHAAVWSLIKGLLEWKRDHFSRKKMGGNCREAEERVASHCLA